MRNFIWIVSLVLMPFTANAQSLPNWYTSPPNDSRESFHSVGSGATLEEAKTDALVTLSTRLIVNLSSEQESQVEKENDSVSMRLISNTVQTTEELAFFKTELLRQFDAQNEVLVLISADKKQVFDAIDDKLTTSITPLFNMENDSDEVKIGKMLQFESMWPTYSKYYRLLKAYDQPTAEFTSRLLSYQNSATALLAQTGYQINSSAESIGISQLIDNQLQTLGYTQGDKPHQLEVTVIGPELQKGSLPNNIAYKAIGKVIYAVNNQVVFENPIAVFQFGPDESVVFQSLKEELKNQVLFGAKTNNVN